MSNLKSILIATLIALSLGALIFWQHRANASLQAENQRLNLEVQTLRDRDLQSQAKLQELQDASSRLRKQAEELAQLRAALARGRQQHTNTASAQTAQRNEPGPTLVVTEAEASAFLQRPKAEQGDVLGRLRRQGMGLEPQNGADFARTRALAEEVRPRLEELESHPEQFAEFQASFVKAAIGLEDEDKVSQIRQIVQETYQKAVAEKLDASSRPQDPDAVQAWALRRDALDRPATHRVQQLLSPEERARFDAAFLGIMGVDLGIHDGAWHRFQTPSGGVVFPSETAQPVGLVPAATDLLDRTFRRIRP